MARTTPCRQLLLKYLSRFSSPLRYFILAWEFKNAILFDPVLNPVHLAGHSPGKVIIDFIILGRREFIIGFAVGSQYFLLLLVDKVMEKFAVLWRLQVLYRVRVFCLGK